MLGGPSVAFAGTEGLRQSLQWPPAGEPAEGEKEPTEGEEEPTEGEEEPTEGEKASTEGEGGSTAAAALWGHLGWPLGLPPAEVGTKD